MNQIVKSPFHQVTVTVLMLLAANASATVLYVDLNSTNAMPPYTDWSTAATNIQDAVDASNNGDQILVANGTYRTGGRAVNGYALTNRVAVTKAITVQSVNGPATTSIQGYQVPGATNGDGAMRCAYLTNGATLAGFTLTKGATRVSGDTLHECNGGGVWCESVSGIIFNCVLSDNAAYSAAGGICYGWVINCTLNNNSARNGNGGGNYQGTLINCTLNSNSAAYGGGAAYATLINCMLNTNSAINAGDYSSGCGGGAYGGTLNNCMLAGNWATFRGGGVNGSTLNSCTLTGSSAYMGGGAAFSDLFDCVFTLNLASEGGGAWYCTLNNCLLTGNSAQYSPWPSDGIGGGVYISTLNNCTLTGNSAYFGGGAHSSTLSNCSLAGNSASLRGGGVYASTANNCIIYFNTATDRTGINHYFCTLDYCCSTCDDGCASFSNDPLFVNQGSGDLHLQSNSPCINAGNNAYVTVTNDLDGNARIKGGTVDIGAYEFQNPTSVISYAWLQQYGLPTNGTADFADTDNDGLNNWQEWIAGTDPTNRLSVLRMLAPTNALAGVTVSWQSVSDRTYYLQRGTNLLLQTRLSSLQSNIVGQAGMTSFTDTTATNAGPYFYRVGVQ
jgi:hypothetical protein